MVVVVVGRIRRIIQPNQFMCVQQKSSIRRALRSCCGAVRLENIVFSFYFFFSGSRKFGYCPFGLWDGWKRKPSFNVHAHRFIRFGRRQRSSKVIIEWVEWPVGAIVLFVSVSACALLFVSFMLRPISLCYNNSILKRILFHFGVTNVHSTFPFSSD